MVVISPKIEEPDYLSMILNSKVYDVAVETPLEKAERLSERIQNNLYLKREDLQPVFSFKIRGAYNRLFHLTNEEKARGIIACSAGNHAQGVAFAAKKLGIKATIVMPAATPSIKWMNVQRFGADIKLVGADFDEAKEESLRIAEERNLVHISPFDDPYVIAGQGTVGLEILKRNSLDRIDAIFCCVGGGGLIAGIAAIVKRIRPEIKIIGVEACDANAMTLSLKAGKRVFLDQCGLFAEGAAIRLVGEEPFRICKESIDEMIEVNNDEVCAAIKDVFEDTRTILEPAGALAVAGAKKYINTQNVKGVNYVAITSGANMNFNRLRFVAERAELGEQREVLVSAIMPEKPGSFHKLNEIIYPRMITEFSYRYKDADSAHILMSFSVDNRSEEIPRILQDLANLDIQAMDISDNELAKSHARYLVGGRVKIPNERLYRFEFPEKPGALKKFLIGLESDWNITLFHYRNFGADVGKVLVGIQVPTDKSTLFEAFLSHLNYRYVDETDNIMYRQFLQ